MNGLQHCFGTEERLVKYLDALRLRLEKIAVPRVKCVLVHVAGDCRLDNPCKACPAWPTGPHAYSRSVYGSPKTNKPGDNGLKCRTMRHFALQGDASVVNAFRDLSKEAGRCLDNGIGIPAETLELGDSTTRWWSALFDLAMVERTPTSVEHHLFHNIEIHRLITTAKYSQPPIDDEEKKAIAGEATQLMREGFYAVLDDVVLASVAAIDYLLSISNQLVQRSQNDTHPFHGEKSAEAGNHAQDVVHSAETSIEVDDGVNGAGNQPAGSEATLQDTNQVAINIFKKENDTWTIRFNGGELQAGIADGKALSDIQYLLRNPGKAIGILDLPNNKYLNHIQKLV